MSDDDLKRVSSSFSNAKDIAKKPKPASIAANSASNNNIAASAVKPRPTPAAQFKSIPLPDLDPVPASGKSKASEADFHTFGLGDENLIHAVQLACFLQMRGDEKHARETPVPQLVTCETSNAPLTDDLRPESIQELLRRAIVLIAVYNGYDVTTESVMQTLVDVCGAFIERLCNAFRDAVDSRALRSEQEISGDLHRIFDDLGFAIPNLQQFVQSLGKRKSKLVQEIAKSYGPVIELPKRSSSSINSATLARPLDLVVGLEEVADQEQSHNNNISWEKSLSVSDLLYTCFTFTAQL